MSLWPRHAQVALALFTILATGFLLIAAREILIPLALATLIAFLLHPLVKRVQRVVPNRPAAVILVVLAAGLAGGTIGYIVLAQAKALADDLPNHRTNIEQKVLALKRLSRKGTLGRLENLAVAIDRRTEERVDDETESEVAADGANGAEPPDVSVPEDNAGRADPSQEQGDGDDADGEAGGNYVSDFPQGTFFASTLDVLATAGIVAILVIFFLIQQADIRDRIVSVTGRGALATTTKALEEAGVRISRFLAMQFVVNASFGLAVTLGLLLIGVPYAATFGLCAAALRYIPYVGPWVAAILPIAVSLAVSPGWGQPALVVLVFIVLELISNNIMEPILYGHSVGLSEVAVILAAIVWAWFWGPIGLVLSTPLTVCLVVLGKYVPGLRLFDQLLGERPPVGAPVRIYQRLLARDDEEAQQMIAAYIDDRSPEAIGDELLLPIFNLIQHDRTQGAIDEEDSVWMCAVLESAIEDLEAPEEESESAGESIPETDQHDNEQTWPVVVGLAARTRIEELALRLVGLSLAGVQCRFEIIPYDLLTSERLARIGALQPALVCVSALPPRGRVYSRQLCKRIQLEFPDINLLTGYWTHLASETHGDQSPMAEGGRVVSTIGAMLAAVRSQIQISQAGRPSTGGGAATAAGARRPA